VAEAVTQRGGFSPGLAARLRLEDGRRCFVKAVSGAANPDTPAMHRREAAVLTGLPGEAAAPRLLWTYDEGGWVALGLTDIDGRTPAQPWRDDELDLVIAGLQRLHRVLTPAPLESSTAAHAFASHIKGWDELKSTEAAELDSWSMRNIDKLLELEASAPEMMTGETLLNFDVRADNMLIADDQVYFVDWPWARIGPPFVDWLALAPSVRMQGGPMPSELLRRAALGYVSERAINATLASLTGYFLAYSRRPAPPGIPTLRSFQAAQGEVALAWLRERVGWR
jgi:aminoglycoside phosphotransferase (APT) family kinase protein